MKPDFGDYVALAALLLSLTLAGIQLKGCIEGPQIEFVKPKVVIIKPLKVENTTYYVISAVMSYLNTGSKDQDDIITDEEIFLTLGTKQYLYRCSSFGDSKEKDGQVDVPVEKGATPVAVQAGRSVSHECHFVVFPEVDINGKDNADYFTESEIRAINSDNFKIDLNFNYVTLKDKGATTNSKIHITKEHLKRLYEKKYISVPLES